MTKEELYGQTSPEVNLARSPVVRIEQDATALTATVAQPARSLQ
jgi:hypothetical protein